MKTFKKYIDIKLENEYVSKFRKILIKTDLNNYLKSMNNDITTNKFKKDEKFYYKFILSNLIYIYNASKLLKKKTRKN